ISCATRIDISVAEYAGPQVSDVVITVAMKSAIAIATRRTGLFGGVGDAREEGSVVEGAGGGSKGWVQLGGTSLTPFLPRRRPCLFPCPCPCPYCQASCRSCPRPPAP